MFEMYFDHRQTLMYLAFGQICAEQKPGKQELKRGGSRTVSGTTTAVFKQKAKLPETKRYSVAF
jgi:hypothetical protein